MVLIQNLSVNDKITSRLKRDWGLNDVWNDLILPRFKRMNELTKSQDFTSWNEKHQKFLPIVPLELSKNFQKKRIDHRHHAMDALVIACLTRDHVNLLNNLSAKSEKSRYDLQYKLRNTEKWIDKKDKERTRFTDFIKPWKTFTEDAKEELKKTIISFKQNLRIINKATNKYEKFIDGKKTKVNQEGVNWAIRKSMHEETVSGIVNLPWAEIKKGNITTATRKSLDKTFSISKIKKITDTGIQKILRNYLTQDKFKEIDCNGKVSYNYELAFSPERIEDMNKNIALYNNGKPHQPIFKVRVYEEGKGRFKLGEKGNKKSKYVQGAPNLFFGIYTNTKLLCKGADKKPTNRCFETIPLNIVIERLKQGLSPLPETNEAGEQLLFYLSPGDLVYVPTEDEMVIGYDIDFSRLNDMQIKRLYNVNDFSSTCYFTPNCLAKAIREKEVDMTYDEKKKKISGSFDIKTASLSGKQIKDICIKLKVDRLGNISKA